MTAEEILNTRSDELGRRLVAEREEAELERRRQALRERRAKEYAERDSLGVRYSDPVTTARSLAKPAQPRGILGRDMMIAEAVGRVAGELAGKTRRELDVEIKALKAELEALRQEVAALRGPSLRSVA